MLVAKKGLAKAQNKNCTKLEDSESKPSSYNLRDGKSDWDAENLPKRALKKKGGGGIGRVAKNLPVG